MRFLRFLFLLVFVWPIVLMGQGKFDLQRLNHPSSYGKELQSMLPTIEVYEFDTSAKKQALIPNGLRSSKYLKEENWLGIKGEVDAVRVDLVFSKYPIRNGKYTMQYGLLCNRIKRLLQIDPELNDPEIEWRLVLQTHCENDDQVDQLYHGAVIHYHPELIDDDASIEEVQTGTSIEPEISEVPFQEQDDSKQLFDLVDEAENSEELPEEVKKELRGKSPKEKQEVLESYLESVQNQIPEEPRSTLSPNRVKQYKKDIKNFQLVFGGNIDPTVSSVLDRNKQWKDVLVVADWTGSMYGYGAQVLEWHLDHLDESGVENLVLFNDGDKKQTGDKEMGSTGGIYSEKADNVKRLFNLYKLVMAKGSGGDIPENDIEALLTGINRFPESGDVVLIADNYACVRDLKLLPRIDRPVHVILCGYNPMVGVNPQYMEIAFRTGGSIHTLEKDIYDVQVELTTEGDLVGYNDPRIAVTDSYCDNSGAPRPKRRRSSTLQKTYTSLEEAKASGNKYIVHLELKEKNYTKIPGQVFKYSRLNTLDLGKNELTSLPGSMKKFTFIRTLKLNNNHLTEIPEKALVNWKYLVHFDLSNNEITQLPDALGQKQFLQYLNLSSNQIQELPESLNMRKLQYCYLAYNDLQNLPKMNRLRRLIELDLSHNQLKELTPTIKSLRKLQVLDLSNNEITQIPDEIKYLTRLKVLNLKGNPLSLEEVEKVKQLLPNTQVRFDA
ncbi:leucine-rich repeat domain-containing protein [bacterium SCSIO 12741]|nr:leucine-rich repeat domain-containing protein [bacterium SCSIO 12741]